MAYGTASDLERITVGMTKPDVMATLGSPMWVSADADKNEERLYYRRMHHAIAWGPTTYEVTLRGGKVVKFGRWQGSGS